VTSIALIGPDGAGKSTISGLLEQADLPAPVKRIYMGVNLESSSLMLPTTRLLLLVKRARGRRPDMTAPRPDSSTPPALRSPARRLFRALRMTAWIAEEWFRVLVAGWYERRGHIIVFDRHFFADYYHFDVASGTGRSKVHGFLLRHVYPKPGLVICLDAPGEVLHRRKQEATPEWLERRRQEYLELADVVPRFVVVDVDRSLYEVIDEVATIVTAFHLEDE